MNKKEFKLERFLPLIRILTILVVLLLTFKVAIFLLPFIIALFVVSITRPIVNFLVSKFKFNLKLANVLVILVFYLIIFTILSLIFLKVIFETISFSKYLIDNRDEIINNILYSVNRYRQFLNILPNEIYLFITDSVSKFTKLILNSSVGLLNAFLQMFKKIPMLIIYTVITIISTLLISNDLDSVYRFFNKQFPKSWINNFKEIKGSVFLVTFNYLKSQLILILLSFLELLIGFTLISIFVEPIQYVLILAITISLIDALPIIGTGGILIPASIYFFAISNNKLAISILLLYLIIAVLRYILEPKILSSNLNINPLLSLVSIYVGFKFFGVIGFLLGPILLTIMTYIFKEEIERGFFKILSGEVEYDKNN